MACKIMTMLSIILNKPAMQKGNEKNNNGSENNKKSYTQPNFLS